jgi:acetylornithine deacetylase/succinyl-diaminopimelate desuccinylase-like protein
MADLRAWPSRKPSPGGDIPSRGGDKPSGLSSGLTPRFQFNFKGEERAWRGDRNNPLVRSFLAGVRTEDPSAQLGFVLKTGTSDMNVVAPVWKCPIVAYGPGDSALDHTPNEHLPLDEYWKAVNVIAHTLAAFAGQ